MEVIKNEFTFPIYSLWCPICGSADCAKFHGYYFRKKVIDENGNVIKNLPIVRYICKTKGKTFSLLPHKLVPYCMYSIDFIFKVLNFFRKKSIKATLDCFSKHMNVFLSPPTLYDFVKMAGEAVEKFSIVGNSLFTGITDRKHRLEMFIEYCNEFVSHRTEVEVRGPPALNIDFWLNYSLFLFGTPSQARKRAG